MKIRTDFVTNSSSSSFIIWTAKLSDEQIQRIKECMVEYGWAPKQTHKTITGYTTMDNDELLDLLCEMDIPKDTYEFDDEMNFYDDEDEDDED